MNPFTKYLRQFSRDSAFDAFVARWDVLEAVVVRVYRGQTSVPDVQPDYDSTWPYLREEYLQWEPALGAYWPATRAAGELTTVDPFRLLLDIPGPEAIVGNWSAMQHLPAARESINRYLVDQSSSS